MTMMHYDLDTLDDYLHGELEAARDAAVHAHLESCEPCRTAFDETASIRDWVRAAAAAETLEFPSLVKARVWEALRSAPEPRFAWLRTGWRPWVAVPVAAVLALATYLGVPATHATPTVGVAASDLLIEHAAQMADNPLADHTIGARASTSTGESTMVLMEAADSAAADAIGDGR